MNGKTEAARNNHTFLVCHIAFQAVILTAYLLEVIKGARTAGYFAVLAAIIIVTVIAETIIYRKDN